MNSETALVSRAASAYASEGTWVRRGIVSLFRVCTCVRSDVGAAMNRYGVGPEAVEPRVA